jgi:acetyl-CoA decarbonylase/synthase complex subunit delta
MKEVTELAFQTPTIKYSGAIKKVKLGSGAKAIEVGGENCYPFYLFEGEMPKKPVIAMEVWDMRPDDWPPTCVEPFADVLDDPGAWAKKCVEDYGAEAIAVQLKSTDPNGQDAPPEKASEAVGKVLQAVDVPVIVWGTANNDKDAEVLKKIAEDHQGKNLLLGPVEEENHKTIGAAALGFNHSLIASSPIDVNLAKQLNILLGNLGVPMERIVIDPTTGGLGYGLEYSYSVMERIRMAALVQEDDKLVLPMINNVGNEVWKTKEAKLTAEEAPDLGDDRMRGVLMEVATAVTLLLAGSDILILRHPESVKQVRNFLEKLAAERAPAAERTKVEREKAKPVAAAQAKPAPKPAAAAKPAPAAPPKPAAPAEAAAPPPPKKVVEMPKPAEKKAAAPAAEEAEAETIAKEEAEAKAKEQAEAKAKAEAAAQAKPEAEERAKREAEQRQREEAEARAEEEEQARRAAKEREREELAELRARRREEREKRAAAEAGEKRAKEGVEYTKGPEPGLAGPQGEYVLRKLRRWRLRGDGVLRR